MDFTHTFYLIFLSYWVMSSLDTSYRSIVWLSRHHHFNTKHWGSSLALAGSAHFPCVRTPSLNFFFFSVFTSLWSRGQPSQYNLARSSRALCLVSSFAFYCRPPSAPPLMLILILVHSELFSAQGSLATDSVQRRRIFCDDRLLINEKLWRVLTITVSRVTYC